MNLKDFRVDQCRRYDHKVVVTHNEFYLSGTLTGLHGRGREMALTAGDFLRATAQRPPH